MKCESRAAESHRTRACRKLSSLAALLGALVFAEGCAGPVEAERTVQRYFAAVQLEDAPALFCLSAGAAGGAGGGNAVERRAAFDGWLRGELEAYKAARESGFVDILASPVRLAKVFTLGKGTFWSIERLAYPESGRIDADVAVRFAYDKIDVSHLSEGTGFYVAGAPPGRVHHIVVPSVPRSYDATVLDTVVVRFRLAWEAAADGCGERWTIVEAEPLVDSITTIDLTWDF